MDQTEFVNVYIDILSKSLHDATNKSIMLEAKIVLLEKANQKLNVELQEAIVELDKHKKKKGSSVADPATDF
jgi:hypothetical protein